MLALSGTVSAQSLDKNTGYYAEFGLAQAYYKEPGWSFNNAMGVFKGGYNLNKYIAAEVMAAGNLNTANGYFGAAYLTAKVSSAYGGYAKFSLPVNDEFSLFVRGGVTNATVNATATNGVRYTSVWQSGSDLSYGAGAQFNFTKDTYGQVDYMSYYNKNNVTVVAPSISVGYKF
jgi:Outer membrane protein beta-barrel domain